MRKEETDIKFFDKLAVIGMEEIRSITEIAICFAKYYKEEINIENVLKEIQNLIEIGTIMGTIQDTINDNATTDIKSLINKYL